MCEWMDWLWEMGSLYSLWWLETYCVDQTDLWPSILSFLSSFLCALDVFKTRLALKSQRSIWLCLLSAELKGVHHHYPASSIFLSPRIISVKHLTRLLAGSVWVSGCLFWFFSCCCLVLKQSLTFQLNCPETHYIIQADPEFKLILLPLSPRCWDYKHRSPCPAFLSLLFWSLRQGLILKPMHPCGTHPYTRAKHRIK